MKKEKQISYFFKTKNKEILVCSPKKANWELNSELISTRELISKIRKLLISEKKRNEYLEKRIIELPKILIDNKITTTIELKSKSSFPIEIKDDLANYFNISDEVLENNKTEISIETKLNPEKNNFKKSPQIKFSLIPKLNFSIFTLNKSWKIDGNKIKKNKKENKFNDKIKSEIKYYENLTKEFQEKLEKNKNTSP